MIIANHVWIKFEALVLLKPCNANENFQNAPTDPRHII